MWEQTIMHMDSIKGISPDEILGEILRTTAVPYKGKRK